MAEEETRPGPATGSPETELQTATPQAGAAGAMPGRLGRYRLIRRIGLGGMGAVYEAEQEKPRRTVALKVIKHGLASDASLRRFEMEAEVLGRLQHAGIAQIYEAGTADTGSGPQPYFAMEFIRGLTLLQHARNHNLDLRQKLELVTRVCDAVQHAHSRGVIHRDLKPSNILVDEAGQAKVLDFGVARVTDSDLHVTRQTSHGELVGTIPYMSPEQVLADPNELDTRSDVYSLGVVVYELLTGRLPYDFDGKTIVEAARTILEVPPICPSTIDSRLRGDIDTILGKALEKDKNRRYGSAAELAGDIQHYLRNEPIHARPPSRSYLLGKFVRRHRTLVSGLAALFIILVSGVVVSTSQAAKARREALKAAAVNSYLHEMLGAASPMGLTAADTLKGREITVMQVLHEAGKNLESGSLAQQPLVEAAVRRTVGATLRDLGDYDTAEANLVKSLETRRALLGGRSAEVAESMDSLGDLYHNQGRLEEAEALLREALSIGLRTLGSGHPDVARTQHNLASVLVDKRELEEASLLYHEALQIRERSLGREHRDTARTLNSLAKLAEEQDDLSAADSLMTEALTIQRQVLGNEHPDVALTLHDLSSVLQAEGRFADAERTIEEAIAIWRRLLGDRHPYLAASLMNLGVLRRDQGKLAEAEPVMQQAVEIMRESLGSEHPNVGASLYNLAKIAQARGNLTEAERLDREALAILSQSLPADHPTLAGIRSGLGSVLTDLGRSGEAEPLLRDAMAVYRKSYPDAWFADQVKSQLGAALMGQGRLAEAETLLLQSYDRLQNDPAVPPDRKEQALQRITRLYETWYAADPDPGRRETLSLWQSKLPGKRTQP